MDAEQGELVFCRVTQRAFLRLLTSPSVAQQDALPRRRAWEVYDKVIADPRVRFLAEPSGLDVLSQDTFNVRGNRRVLAIGSRFLDRDIRNEHVGLPVFEHGRHFAIE